MEDALRAIDGVLSVKTHEVRGTTYTPVRLVSGMSPYDLVDTLEELEATRPSQLDGTVHTEGGGTIIVEYEHP